MKKLSAGMIKDTALVDQPEGSMRDALNANLNIEKGTVTNEYGTYEIRQLDGENLKVLGKVVTDEDEIIMFGQLTTFTPEGTINLYESRIVYLNTRSKEIVTLYKDRDLNFRQSHPIVCTYRRNQANEILVYFTDGFKEYEDLYPGFDYISQHNPPRVINVTKQLNFRRNGGAAAQLYAPGTSIHKLNLTPRIGDHTTIDSVKILSGGSIKTGAYYLGLAYADNEGLETNYFVVSNPVYITQRPENTIPTDAFIGSEGGIETAKSIQWTVTIPQSVDYDLLQPAVIKKEKGSISIVKIPPVTISVGGGTARVTYTGTERSTILNEQDVIVDDVEYITADTLSQLDNRLYLGNVTANKDIGFQPFAHNIEIEAVQDEINFFTPRYYDTVVLNEGYTKLIQTYDTSIGRQYAKGYGRFPGYGGSNLTAGEIGPEVLNGGGYITGTIDNSFTEGYYEVLRDVMISAETGETLKGYRSPRYSFKKKGYRRNEVYAFYISFVLKDGTETYAYHIPGKEASFIQGGGTDPGVYEDTVITASDADGGVGPYNIHAATRFLPFEMQEQYPEARLHQILDTNARTSDGMGHWSNTNEFYPDTDDFRKGSVSSTGEGNFDSQETLSGSRVRHHKFPGNTTNKNDQSFGFVRDSNNVSDPFFNDNDSKANLFMGKQTSGEDGIPPQGAALNTNVEGGDNGGFSAQETVRILGFKIKNLKIPKSILEKVQGYKIYYAKRTRANKTILGQSIAVPGHVRYASVAEQNIAAAMKGPYKKAFYMYGGLDHSDDSSIDTLGRWRYNIDDPATFTKKVSHTRYYAHPVFKFHDFNLLRNRENLSSATHISLQYGVIFKQFQGGPGVFVKSCDYDKIKDAPSSEIVEDLVPYVTENQVEHKEMHTTSFPSLGWVSAVMKNNLDFFVLNKYKVMNIQGWEEDLLGKTRILDISDTLDVEHQNENEENDDLPIAKRARLARRGEDLDQPIEQSDSEQIVAREAKAARVRAWFTSVMIGGVYVTPDACLKNRSIIKGGDFKQALAVGGGLWLNRFWGNNGPQYGPLSYTLALEPGGLTFLPGLTEYEVKDNASFKGAAYLYNNAGESAIAMSLVSGLPALRGHLPRYEMEALTQPNGIGSFLTRWGEPWNYLYPDAAQDGISLAYQRQGFSSKSEIIPSNGDWIGDLLFDPKKYRGEKYKLESSNPYYGYPMAWLINLCSVRTDVFNPFDRQELVWTGYFKRIDVSDIDTGTATDDDDVTSNYYTGAESDEIFGGDTYISKYSIRVTSQSYGHAYFRSNINDAQGGYIDASNDYIDAEGEQGTPQASKYYTNLGLGAEGTQNRFQADIPANLNKFKYTENNTYGFGTTSGEPVWAIDQPSAASTEYLYPFSGTDLAGEGLRGVIDNPDNWVKGNVNPVATLMTFMCESDDLIEFRHAEDVEKGVTTKFFDHNTANSTLFAPPTQDFTKPENLLYNDDYSSVQDIKVTQPLPVYGELAKVQTFPRRIVRSNVDSGSLADGYRKFRALEYKDINSDKGEIKNLFAYRGNLYIHTDRSLFFTAGKEELQVGPATAFIGSGDIFTRDPNEVQESDTGYGGTTSRHCHVTTPYGHYYLNYRDRRFYGLEGQGITDITQGMESWLRENMQFAVERFEIDIDSPKANANGFFTDATAGDNVPLGFTMGYDPMFRRILITKHEPIPTDNFMRLYNAGAIVIADNIAYRISTADDSCTETDTSGPISIGGSDDQDIDISARVPVKRAGEVYCGPIWFGNPYYFKQSGWTISYYPEAKIWGSRHSYRPDTYANTSEHMISFKDRKIWEHSNKLNPGRYYGTTYPFEVEYIDNTGKTEAKLYSSIYYWADSKMFKDSRLSETVTVTNPVFTSFYVYNTTQISGTGETINYLSNARLVDRTWHINSFRDMSKQVFGVSDTIYEPDDAEGNNPIEVSRLITHKENVAGYVTESVALHPQNKPMFKSDGSVNPEYININKEWHNQRKFIDHFLGVRLIYDNSDRNLVHLYGVGTKFRKSYR